MKGQRFEEGDCFSVPLGDGTYALGVVARKRGRSPVLLGFFFGPRRSVITGVDLADLKPSDTKLIAHFGHLALRDGRWPVVGAVPDWTNERGSWNATRFFRRDVVSGAFVIADYTDDDRAALPRERRTMQAEEVLGLPEDGLLGARAVESWLDKEIS